MTQHLSTARLGVCALALPLLCATGARAQTVYFSNSSSAAPYSKTWNGTTWSAATVLPTIDKSSDAQWIQAAASPLQTEVVVAIANPNPHRAKYVMFNTGHSFTTPTQLSANSTDTATREIAVAYEQLSGDCMLAYSPESDDSIAVQIASAGVLGSVTTAITPGGNPASIRLYPRSGSDEILLLAVDSAKDLFARVWSGSSWGAAATTISTTLPASTNEPFAAAYESSSGSPLLVYAASGSSTPSYRTYSGGSWSGASSMTACNGTPQFIRLAAKPGSDEMICAILDNTKRLRVYVWSGSSWASTLEVCTDCGVNDRRAFDVAYSPDGSKALLVYSNNSTTPVYRTYSGGSWSAAVNMSSLGANQPQVVQLKPWGTAGDIWVLMSNSGRDLDAWKWNGSSMGTMSTLETSLGGALDKEQFWMPGPATVAALKIVKWAEVDP